MAETAHIKKTFWDIVKQEHIILIALVFVIYYVWSLLLPFGVAPDEPMRYQLPQFIYQNGYLPYGVEPGLRDPNWGISYGFSPYLAQLIGVGFMKITSFFTTNAFSLLMAARLVNVLSATATVWISIKISKQLFKGMASWLFVVLIAALPQFIYLGTYVNNDSFAIFSSAIILYAWIIGIKQRWPMKSCILLGIGMGLCAMSYYNAYGWLLASVILFFGSNLAMERVKWRDRSFRIKIYVVAGLFAAIAAWWFIRSYFLYDGDILGLRISEHYKGLYAIDELKAPNAYSAQNLGATLSGMLTSMGWAKLTYCSAIGAFGAMDVWLPIWVYVCYSAIFLLALIGCIMRFAAFIKEKGVRKSRKWLMGSCMFLTVIIPIGLSIYYSYTSDFQPQGRYILSMLLSFMAFVTIGITTFFQRIIGEKLAEKVMICLCIGLVAIAGYCFAAVYLPLYA